MYVFLLQPSKVKKIGVLKDDPVGKRLFYVKMLPFVVLRNFLGI